MDRLIDVNTFDDILPEYRNTPVGLLLEYHNLHKEHENCENAQLLIGMCMDNRKHLEMSDKFAYIIRSGGANMQYSEFKISFAIAVGGVEHIALIAHTHCGMVDLQKNKTLFVQGLVDRAGWDMNKAEEHFLKYADKFEIHNEIDFILCETERLRHRYPKIQIAPLLYRVEDNKLYLVKE